MTESNELRKQAKALEDKAWALDRETARQSKSYMIVEVIQDDRPRVSGPFTWDEAAAAARSFPNRTICDFGALLP